MNRNMNRMSIKGFKRSFKKSNQFLSEKIGIAKSTELDPRYTTLEKKVDVITKIIDESREKTHELLQPNPLVRTKLSLNNKIHGDEKAVTYPQPETQLGELLIKYSNEIGDNSNFGHAMLDLGESFRQMSAYKSLLELNIKQNFIEPLTHLKHNDLKSIMHSRRTTESLRLDYDSLRNQKKHSYKSDQELQRAGERFEQSKVVTEAEMIKLLNNETDQITVLQNLANGLLDYHKKCDEVLRITIQDLNQRQKALKQGGNRDFLSAKTRQIKHQIADIVKQDERNAENDEM